DPLPRRCGATPLSVGPTFDWLPTVAGHTSSDHGKRALRRFGNLRYSRLGSYSRSARQMSGEELQRQNGRECAQVGKSAATDGFGKAGGLVEGKAQPKACPGRTPCANYYLTFFAGSALAFSMAAVSSSSVAHPKR